MSTDVSDTPLRDFSPATAGARLLFAFLKWLSPMQWLGWIGRRIGENSYLYLFRPRSELTRTEIDSEDFTRRRARAIEFYLFVWLAIELILVFLACTGPWPFLAGALLVLAAASRIIEIIQVTVNATLFDALSGRPDERVASRARMLVLAGINFVEILLCFGVIYAVDFMRLHGAGRPITAFYFSTITQLTIGYGDVYPTGRLRLVAAAHGLVSTLFVVLVFGRFMAALPQVRGMFGERDP